MYYDFFAVITNDKCYFCNGHELIRFAEHWTFCPNCAAIYTRMVLNETNCEHINKSTPVVTNDCWFRKNREKKVYIKYLSFDDQSCSKCGKPCEADGW